MLVARCSGSGDIDVQLNKPTFPSTGSPSGNNAVSASTNFSQKAFDPRQKADPLAGAAFVAPPQISNYGAVSFSYQLDVPTGRAGVEPKIGLSYSSSGGDGWTGIGWSIGMGAITRTTNYGPLAYDKRDIFTYSGKRLIKVAGPANSENGEYRAEIEDGSFAKLSLTQVENGGVWTVQDKSGTTTVYGEALSQRIYHKDSINKTYAWNFSRSIDINSNYLMAIYDDSEFTDKRVLYLKELRYTGNSNVGFNAYQYIRFNLRSRTTAEGAYISSGPGFVMKMDKLLESIEMGWDNPSGGNNTKLWQYDIEYATSTDSNRPLIQTIRSDRKSTHPVFHYQAAIHQFVWNQVGNLFSGDPELNPKSTKYFEGDVNGDGKSDFIFFNPKNGEWKVVASWFDGSYRSSTWGLMFQGYEGDTKIQFFKGNVTGDYDGNGKSDVAFYLPEKREFWVAESKGDHFEFVRYGKFTLTSFDLFAAEWFTGDYDGNGISDIVLFDEKSGDWILMKNTGSPSTSLPLADRGNGFQFLKFSNAFKNLYREDFSAGGGPYGSSTTQDKTPSGRNRGKIRWLSGDFNGDGRSDTAFYDERSHEWWVGENTFLPAAVSPAPNFTITFKLYKVFTAPEQTLFGHDRFSGDFNGDGFTDFLLFDRAARKWWLGATTPQPNGTSTINFTIWSSIPSQIGELTRWLQGDFNGDGRTDIGFYSKTDNKFWIGEATPNGFRYRIYNDLDYNGPGTQVVDAPKPEDEVLVGEGKRQIAGAATTTAVSYVYDKNESTERGERVFPGCFSGLDCQTHPEMFVHDKKTNKVFVARHVDASTSALSNLVALDVDAKILNERAIDRYTVDGVANSRDEVLIYSKFGTTHYFKVFRKSLADENYELKTIAQFTDAQIPSFSITDSLWGTGNGIGQKHIYVLDDQFAAKGRMAVFKDLNPATAVYFDIDVPAPFTAGLYQVFSNSADNTRPNRNRFRFFTGNFTAAAPTVQMLMVDMRSSPHKYYLADFNDGLLQLNFAALTATQSLPSGVGEEFPEDMSTFAAPGLALTGTGQHLIWTYRASDQTQFSRLVISNGAVSVVSHGALDTEEQFQWEKNHEGKFLITDSAGLKTLSFTTLGINRTGVNISDNAYQSAKIERPDLYTKVYPFEWIQGDYNGDGKTDLGFFHLKQPKWYFALTQGTVPDLIQSVENGIGGSYEFEYANSSSFDNTGGDGIPDLSVNYKVCTKLTLNDGVGNVAYNSYSYKGGYAFTAYMKTPTNTGSTDFRKETDFYGFQEFVTTDAQGSQTINIYNNVLFSNYLYNRVLAGALKETRFNGWDYHEYNRTENTYSIKEINQPGAQGKSFWAFLAQTKNYKRTVPASTVTNVTNLVPNAYQISDQTVSTTDHYVDAAHPEETTVDFTAVETVSATNQQRPFLQKKLSGSSAETSTFFSYDSFGNLAQRIERYTGSGLAAAPDKVVEFQYDGFGNKVAQTDVSASPSRRTEFNYDSRLNQFMTEERLVNTVAIVQTTAHDYARAFGQPVLITDANSNKRYIEYDSFGRLTRVRADTDAGVETLTELSYGTNGEEIPPYPLSAKTTQYSGAGSGGTNPDIKTRVFKDGVGREIHSVQSALDTPGKYYTKTGKRVYDALGRVIRQSQVHWAEDDEIDVYKAHSTEKNPTVTKYDGSGRVMKVTFPKASPTEAETSVSTTYNDPFEVIATHSSGQGNKRSVSNARGHLLYIDDFGRGSDMQDIRAKMGFCYDIAGRRVKRSDLNQSSVINCSGAAGENVSRWVYDGLGRVVSTTDPDMGTTSMAYNAFGDLASKTDALNRTTYFQYDRLARMTQKVLPNGEGNVTYSYDTLAGSANAIGKMVALDDNAQRLTLSYDKLGHRAAEVRQLKTGGVLTGAVYNTQFKYDLLDRTTEIEYPTNPADGSHGRACYQYNSFGLPEKAKYNYTAAGSGCFSTTKDIVSHIDYDEFASMTRMERGNGINSVYTYDIKGRVQNIAYEQSSTVLVNASYTYDTRNNILAANIAPTAAAAGSNFASYASQLEYEYDGLNRLLTAQGLASRGITGAAAGTEKFQRAYEYALNGNLTAREKQDYDTDAVIDRWNYAYAGHRVTQIDSSSQGSNHIAMAYDAVGNTTSRVTTGSGAANKAFVYDSYNRQRTSIVNGANVGTYEYDDLGYRVRKVSQELLDNQQRLVELESPNMYFALESQKDIGGVPIANTAYALNNVYLNGVRIAAVIPSGQARYFMADQLDSVNLVTNDAGGIVTRHEYLPFGEEWFAEGETSYKPKYNGQEFDRESGLYYFNARHQDPEIGRFSQADTVIDGETDTQGWNRYSYVHNNPIKYKDPTGHEGKGGFTGGQEEMSRARMNMSPEERKMEQLGKERAAETKAYNSAMEKQAVENKLQAAKNRDYNSYGSVLGVKIAIPGSDTVNRWKESYATAKDDLSRKMDNVKSTVKQINQSVTQTTKAVENMGKVLKPIYEQGATAYDAVKKVTDTIEKVSRVTGAAHIAPASGLPVPNSVREPIQEATKKALPKIREKD